jgi:hypothetical protein
MEDDENPGKKMMWFGQDRDKKTIEELEDWYRRKLLSNEEHAETPNVRIRYHRESD